VLVANQKLKENIAEYILYMYQIEDVIRAFKFDSESIIEMYVKPQLPDQSFVPKYRAWYDGLILDMQSERITETGHLIQTQEILVELSYLHNSLLTVLNDEKYIQLFERAVSSIDDFKERSNLKDKNHIEICFHGLYMKLLLRLQKKEISAETEEAFDHMRIVLAYLSRSYHQMKSGEGEYWKN
jgi:Domain of unknown function (DUF4924)